MIQTHNLSISAQDHFALSATLYEPASQPSKGVIVVNSATGVAQTYYKAFASFLAEQGYQVLTYDYRGIGASRPASLRGFSASMRDWLFCDMASVLEWVKAHQPQASLFMVGHSFGGQVVGLLPNAEYLAGLVTLSSQNGYWRLQGGGQKQAVMLHMHFTLPVLSRLFGYFPFSKISSGEDLPKGVALEWARWCRHPNYLLDDDTLPLDAFQKFKAPVLAYSFADDMWGTEFAVNAMMSAYPQVTRRHISPSALGLKSIGHFGAFRPTAQALWHDIALWFQAQA